MGSLLSSYQSQDKLAGYHVLQVQENSPAEEAGLEQFFDFIVAIDNSPLIGCDETFLTLLQQKEGLPTPFRVYSCRTNQYREVIVKPKAYWNGTGDLGLTIRYCTVKEALGNVRHVLKVFPDSPAEMAGLNAYTDYIIGAELSVQAYENSFGSFLQKFDRQLIELFVYNVEDATCRLVKLIPNCNWGGGGSLGCTIGNGLMHQIPKDSNSENPLAIARHIINSIIKSAVSGSQQAPQTLHRKFVQDPVINQNNIELKSENLVPSKPMNPIIKKSCNLNKSFEVQGKSVFYEIDSDVECVGKQPNPFKT